MSTERETSLEKFRKLTDQMKQQVHDEAIKELHAQADDLVETIKSVTPIYRGPPLPDVSPGALRDSVRVVPDSSKDYIVRVVAGGTSTQHPTGWSTFNYARAVEFGTHEMKAIPFFFPTYRLRKKSIIAAMKRRITKNIKQYSAEK